MKKLNTSVALAALAAIFLAAPAVAADLTAPMPEAANWTAFHVGIGGGGIFGFVQEDSDSFLEANNFNALFASGEHHSDLGDADWFGTVEAGFDYQIDSIVIGVLANYDFGKNKMENKSSIDIFDNNGNSFRNNGTYETKWEIGDSWAIGARLGFLAMDNALIYVMGGYTEAKIKSESELSDNNNANIRFHTSDSSWEDGWFVGGGIEALLTDNISLKAEYRFNDYGSVNRDDDETNGIPGFDNSFANSNQDGDVTVHSVRAVLSYRFGLGL
jgi:outer membrane immunogenic protein